MKSIGQQALVDAAIAERKRRAEAEAEQQQRGGGEAIEQVTDDAERGTEPQQPNAGADNELTPKSRHSRPALR